VSPVAADDRAGGEVRAEAGVAARSGPPVDAVVRIGAVAERAGVSPRTIRYYEELGLLEPTGYSAGGARRFSEDDVARLVRIRELQELLGFDLGEIGEILRGEDRLAGIRSEWSNAPLGRRREMLAQAVGINDRLRHVVGAKQDRLRGMMTELEEKAARYRARGEELAAGAGERRAARARRKGN
jgi:MerR family transcriptional regulator, repressor of the yfmOP operon